MQSLSVSNLQVFELEDNGYLSGSEYNSKNSPDNKTSKKKLKLRLSFPKFGNKSHKYDINLNDSGYISGTTSSETVFSIDNNNYVNFKVNPLRQLSNNSSQSLYDKIPVDLTEVFGLNFKSISVPKNIDRNLKTNSSPILPLNSSENKPKQRQESQQYVQKVKYENRSWDQIHKLSEAALDQWVSSSANNHNSVNNVFNKGKSFEFFEPNPEAKNSLLLNRNLLYQPIRRYTSELNLRQLIFNSNEFFSDDSQMEAHFVCDEQPSSSKDVFFSDQNSETSDDLSIYTEEIYDLFMDLHEFRVNDENIEAVADKICKVDKYLMSRITSNDLSAFLLAKSMCGCSLGSLCSVIQFSQALAKIVVDCIDCKIAAYQRIAYIIAFIKLAMSLYQKSNWQSLTTMVSALHTIRIFRMNSEWIQIRRNHRYYFDEFIKMSAIVRSSETCLMYSIPRGIPSLRTLLMTQKVDCMSKWDRMERPAKWTQTPGIIDWLEREMKCSLKSIIKYRAKKIVNGMDDSLDIECPPKQFICFIPLNSLPQNWLNRSTKNMPDRLRSDIIHHIIKSLKSELKV